MPCWEPDLTSPMLSAHSPALPRALECHTCEHSNTYSGTSRGLLTSVSPIPAMEGPSWVANSRLTTTTCMDSPTLTTPWTPTLVALSLERSFCLLEAPSPGDRSCKLACPSHPLRPST